MWGGLVPPLFFLKPLKLFRQRLTELSTGCSMGCRTELSHGVGHKVKNLHGVPKVRGVLPLLNQLKPKLDETYAIVFIHKAKVNSAKPTHRYLVPPLFFLKPLKLFRRMLTELSTGCSMGCRTELSHGVGHKVKNPKVGGQGRSLTEFRTEYHGVPQRRSTLDS